MRGDSAGIFPFMRGRKTESDSVVRNSVEQGPVRKQVEGRIFCVSKDCRDVSTRAPVRKRFGHFRLDFRVPISLRNISCEVHTVHGTIHGDLAEDGLAQF